MPESTASWNRNGTRTTIATSRGAVIKLTANQARVLLVISSSDSAKGLTAAQIVKEIKRLRLPEEDEFRRLRAPAIAAIARSQVLRALVTINKNFRRSGRSAYALTTSGKEVAAILDRFPYTPASTLYPKNDPVLYGKGTPQKKCTTRSSSPAVAVTSLSDTYVLLSPNTRRDIMRAVLREGRDATLKRISETVNADIDTLTANL